MNKLTLTLAALFFGLTLGSARAHDGIVVASKTFTESYILGEIVKQTIQSAHETTVEHKKGLGKTGIVFAALRNGSIDLYTEYTGTISEELLKDKTLTTLNQMNAKLAPMGLAVGVPLGFNDTYAFAMPEATAAKLGISKISDLAKHPELRFGLSHEFLSRSDGWPGVSASYGLSSFQPKGIDHGLAYEALADGQIDVTDIYSTDAKINKYHLKVLEDDHKFFPAYDAVLLYRSDIPTRYPKSWAALQKLQGTITASTMVKMNAAAELDHRSFADIAKTFLRSGAHANFSKSGKGPAGLLGTIFDTDFWRLTREHLYLVFVSLLASILTGVPLGILAAKKRMAASSILSAVGIIQTIPSIALLVFLLSVTHTFGTVPALIALFLYALLPIVRNTYSGLLDIPQSLRESADALGLSWWHKLTIVEIPLASRSIMSGIKTSAVINVGTATIAAFVGAGGYGEKIVSGLAINDNTTLLAGAIPAALLAIIIQLLFDGLDRWIIPAGLRSKRA